MPQAVWREQMDLNYPPLDEEHKAFLEVVNRAELAAKIKDFTAIDKVFEDCYAYARNHFSHEESIMEKIQFPDMIPHMRSHQVFIRNISDMRQQYEVASSELEKAQIAERVAGFLSVWFIGHVLSRDKVLKPYLVRLRNLPPSINY